MFFNHLKHALHVEALFSRTENGILVEVYSALILYLLTQIVIALAAVQTGQPLEAFSFKKSCELVKAFVWTHLASLLRRTKGALLNLLRQLVQAVASMGRRNQRTVLA